MKNILVLGGSGMLGSMVASYLIKTNYHITVTLSKPKQLSYDPHHILYKNYLKSNLLNTDSYDYVINCVGAIKQKHYTTEEFYYLNSIFPQNLSLQCKKDGNKLIHYSSDCIFSGLTTKPYSKTDLCDAIDDYGKSKFLGEPKNAIVFRSSIIGPALDTCGLFEWFRSQTAIVRGFTNHYWSGLTTLEMAKQTEKCIVNNFKNDLYQIASTHLSKHDLLCKINKTFGLNKTIVATESNTINRCLVSDYDVTPIDVQLQELKDYVG